MKSLLRRYVSGLQVLRVKAGLTVVSSSEMLKSLIRDFLVVLTIGSLITFLSTLYGVNLLHLTCLLTSSTIIAATLPYLKYKLLVRARSKALENEFMYFVVSEAITLASSTELVNDICELSGWEDVFPTLSRDGLRLRIYRKFLTLFESINHYVKYVQSGITSKLLSDYVLAVSRGMVGSWITHTSTELLRKLGSDVKMLIKLKTTTVLVMGILVSYLPTLIFSLSIITGNTRLSSATVALVPIIIASMVFILPLNTQHLKIYFRFNLIRDLITYTSYVMISYTAYHMLINPTSVITKYLTFLTTSILLINGVLGLRRFYGVVSEIYELPKIIYMFAETPHILINPVKALKEVLSRCRSKSLRELGTRLDLNNVSGGIKVLNSWLGTYVYYIIVKSLINGSLSREQLLSLRIITLDMLEDLKQYFISVLPLIMMSFVMPWIMASMASLAGVEVMNYVPQIYLLTMTYSIYVDYVVFNMPKVTLVSAITSLFLNLLWCVG